MSGDRARARIPRRISPGALPRREPGTEMDCLVLASGPEEWVAVDLASGALVRTRPWTPPGLLATSGGDNGAAPASARPDSLVAVRLELGGDDEPRDPARPEVVVAVGVPALLGRPRRRRVRRLLRRLAAPEHKGAAILSSRGPSIAYVDLDAGTPSVVVVATSPKRLELFVRDDGVPVCALTWAGTTQVLPVLDERARHVALVSAPRSLRGEQLVRALGFKPGFVVCGLTAVRAGHAPKAVLAVLPA